MHGHRGPQAWGSLVKGWHARRDQGATQEGSGLSRRTITKGAAWATPLLVTSVAAPAFAASGQCLQGADSLNTSGVVTFLVFPPSGVQGNLTFTSSGTTDQTPGDTGKVFSTDYTPSWRYIKLHHPEGMEEGDTIKMTITFTEFVKNATLTLTDIDKAVGQWIDHVVAEPAGYVASNAGQYVTGAGTSANPFTSSHNGGITSARGDVTLTWPFSLKQITITYIAADTDNSSDIGQHIGVGKFAFNNC
jgi:hypothetical protein